MQDQIGLVAGKIWRRLGEKGGVSVSTLPKLVGEKSDVVSMALGWLARESKIEFVTKVARNKQSSCTVSLTADELNVFQSTQAPVAASK